MYKEREIDRIYIEKDIDRIYIGGSRQDIHGGT